MSSINLECKQSLSLFDDSRCITPRNNLLLLGQNVCQNYLIYLFFESPSVYAFKNLQQARLILYKFPVCGQKYPLCDDYKISPLLDYLNIYKCQCAMPKICETQNIYFRNNVHKTYTDVDITCIVSAWMENKIENKGLILKGIDHAGLITYASNRHCLFGMRPIIRLIYNDTFCNSWETVPCIVNVKT